MIPQNELRLLVKVATLYYNEGLKQKEIAQKLDLSQSQVSRFLGRCLSEGIVKISVHQPSNIFVSLEEHIQQRYGITQAVIVDVPDDPPVGIIRSAIGTAAMHYLRMTLKKDDLIGISSWSETIRAMLEHMPPSPTPAGGVVQILGGVGMNGNLHATMLTYSLARLLGCEPYLLPAHSVERSVEEKERILQEREVRSVVEKFSSIDIAIVGVGSTEPSSMVRDSGNNYLQEMVSRLKEQGAVGDICLHYYDAQGQAILEDHEDPVVSMSLEQIKQCPRVVALAGGLDKVESIRAALIGGLIDVLVTDRITASELV